MEDDERVAERIARSTEQLSDALEHLANEVGEMRPAVARIDEYVQDQRFEDEVERRVDERMEKHKSKPVEKSDRVVLALPKGWISAKMIGGVLALLGTLAGILKAIVG